MIIMNGYSFAETESEFTNALFSPVNGRTCNGYAKRFKHSIKFYNLQKELIAVINKWGVLCSAHKRENGYWYSYCDIAEFGGDNYPYGIQCSDISHLAIKKDYSHGMDVKHFYK